MSQPNLSIRKTERFGMQRKIVANMTTESWQNIPHASFVYEPDVTGFWNEWLRLKKLPEWEGISINSLMLYACTQGFLAAPEMNAHLSFNRKLVAGTITQYNEVNISMPAAMSDGKMMTLNVRGCDSKTLRELSDYIADLYRKMEKTNLDEAMYEVSFENTVRLLKKLKFPTILGRFAGLIPSRREIHRLKGQAKKDYAALPSSERLTKHDIEQGTILISNLGSVYRGANNLPTIIDIIPPMVCAIALGSFADKPGVITRPDGSTAIEPRKYLTFNINMDHRALDYDRIVPFMQRMDEIFAKPGVMEEWLVKTAKE